MNLSAPTRIVPSHPAVPNNRISQLILLGIFIPTIILPTQLRAQCPGSMTRVTNVPSGMFYRALMSSDVASNPPPAELDLFIGTGCTAESFGTGVINCSVNDLSFINQLQVRFDNSAANSNMNGCTFNCEGGTCRVRGGDALPVELMDFGINDDTTASDAEDHEPKGEDRSD